MPSGYEKSPDYGGEPPKGRGVFDFALFLFTIFVVAPVALYVFTRGDAQKCWELAKDAFETVERDGIRVSTLNLKRIPKGECAVIRP
jgi:hypothetical protein